MAVTTADAVMQAVRAAGAAAAAATAAQEAASHAAAAAAAASTAAGHAAHAADAASAAAGAVAARSRSPRRRGGDYEVRRRLAQLEEDVLQLQKDRDRWYNDNLSDDDDPSPIGAATTREH